MSKTLKRATQLEEKLAKLAGPEWDSDDSENLDLGNVSKGDDDDEGVDSSEKNSNSADFVALSSAVNKRLANSKGKGGKGGNAAVAPQTANVIYLGHIPHGFYEKQMQGFFSQFGDVTRLRLCRSKKTARSKGYAFIEFDSAEVAQVVAETMNGYYLDGRKLVCDVVDPAKIHERLFEGADKKFRVIPWRKLERERRAAPKTEDDARKCLGRLIRGDNRKKRKLAALGIDYDFPGYKASADVAYVNKHGMNRKAQKAIASKEEGTAVDDKKKKTKTKASAVEEKKTAKAGKRSRMEIDDDNDVPVQEVSKEEQHQQKKKKVVAAKDKASEKTSEAKAPAAAAAAVGGKTSVVAKKDSKKRPAPSAPPATANAVVTKKPKAKEQQQKKKKSK